MVQVFPSGAVSPGTGAADLGKAEDAAHTSADVGVAMLGVRRDTAASSTATDGDYATVNLDATGRLWSHVGVVDAVTPGTAAGSLGKAEDDAHNSGDTGVAILGVRRDTAASSGANGDYVTINTDATGQTWTHVGTIDAGEIYLGEVGGKTIVLKPTITVDTGIYAALDILGALVVSGVVTLTGAVRISGGTGVLQSLSVYDDDNEKSPISFLFFDSAPSGGTYVGNGALALSTADKAAYIGKVNVAAGDYETLGGDAFACIRGIGLAVKASGSANLYMIPLVTSGTPTYTAATDIQVVLTFLVD